MGLLVVETLVRVPFVLFGLESTVRGESVVILEKGLGCKKHGDWG